MTIGEAPDGLHALLIAELARAAPGGVIHVARDDARMMAVFHGLRFYAPDIEVLTFSAWDCLPYDRVSPNAELVSRRMATLARLAERDQAVPGRPGVVVVTTVNAILQRLPARAVVAGSSFAAAVGDTVRLDALERFLTDNGYVRSGAVMEPGEFAVRGGIADIYPPGADEPVRLDLFGDVLDGVRTFDPLTQRTTGRTHKVVFKLVSETTLDRQSIDRFRAGYTALFGVAGQDDPLYAAVSAGRRHFGMEHWLPLFHQRLETLFEFMPAAALTLDHLFDEAREARHEVVADYYGARLAHLGSEPGAGAVYKPLAPDRLYLSDAEWRDLVAARSVGALSPYRAADTSSASRNVGGKEGWSFAAQRADPNINVFDSVRDHILEAQRKGRRVLVASYSDGARDRLARLLEDHGIESLEKVADWSAAEALPLTTTGLAVLGLERGFETETFVAIGEQDMLGERLARPPRRQRRAENFVAEASELSPGDIVIHVDHGIGRYVDLQTLDVAGAPHDCLCLVYDGGDRLFIPVENIDVLSRYGSAEAGVQLDRLGSSAWQARMARVKKRVRAIAQQLIGVAAQRRTHQVDILAPPDGLYEEFCARFPYHETEDQGRAIDDVLADLASGEPMDRLICGDVGFGKTEVALRSAFIAAMGGTQVAIVCPTTLLCRQHYHTFCARFEGLPVRIGQLSRLVAAKEVAATKRDLASGELDIVIGTHALLGKQVSFHKLGLLVIDEEQHFGVAHKERLKQLGAHVHVLTLTATPIPRTLQMALSGVRSMSLIATPPADRLSIRSFILPFDPVVVREAILREHYRGGQTFYICPRVADLPEAAGFLKSEIPEVKLGIAHGRLAARELDRVMNAFYDGAYDVLLSTSIVESGLDIPTVNTMIVHRADMFGLAQLYQLRGRIGRSKTRAYAYLTVPPRRVPTAGADRRLQVMQSLDGLGAGFSVASYDLDIRGAGNLLGEEQSGHIKEVGLELYQEMLEEAVATLQQSEGTPPRAADDKWSPQINIGTSVLIPDSYIGDLNLRMGLYRRLSRVEGRAEIDAFAAELIDRFGPLPGEVEHLLDVVAIKHLCRAAGVGKVEAGPKGATLSFRHDSFANPAGLVEFISRQADTTKLRPNHQMVYMRAWTDADERLAGVHGLLEALAGIARQGTDGAAALVDSPAIASNT